MLSHAKNVSCADWSRHFCNNSFWQVADRARQQQQQRKVVHRVNQKQQLAPRGRITRTQMAMLTLPLNLWTSWLLQKTRKKIQIQL